MKVLEWAKEKLNWAKARLAEPLTLKAKLVITVLLLVIVGGGGTIAYKFYDFTQNNPKFCVGCHLMQEAYDSWAKSEHKKLNCHDCHHLTIPEQNQLLISFVMHRPTKVPARHGKVIVGSHTCNECHTSEKAPRINTSLFHAKHVYMEQLECTYCHGEVKEDKSGLHRFLPTEKFCLKCHAGKAVHGEGMGGLACLNCHTDRTRDLKPGRKKCLYCHSNDENIRKELREDATMDVRYFAPDQSTIKKATKIVFDEKAPMQFYCYECHKPHTQGKVKPTSEHCLTCHAQIPKIGKHKAHLAMDMQCKHYHKPHLWKVTEASAKKTCSQCHEYRSPKSFL
ncbi:MAG: cytochrome c3 family protein [Nitrospiraceae bacterium]|nr:cytochrome c3 family protein [Nitrospiraceae bacterium]